MSSPISSKSTVKEEKFLMCLYAWLVMSELNISSYQKKARAVWSDAKNEKLLKPKWGFLFVFQASCNICTEYADSRHKLVIKRLCRCASFTLAACAISLVFEWGETKIQYSMSAIELHLWPATPTGV